MPAYYFDSSALVKAYVVEVGTPWVRGILDPAASHQVHIVSIGHVEVTSAVARRRQAGSLAVIDASAILAQLDVDVANELIVINVSGRLVGLAAMLVDKHGLRAYDGLHLAAALQVSRVRSAAGLTPLTVISSDLELNAAAVAEGLSVEDPNNRP